nr:zinc finger CCCH domain-containing protein 32-like [Ipomoea batatas]
MKLDDDVEREELLEFLPGFYVLVGGRLDLGYENHDYLMQHDVAGGELDGQYLGYDFEENIESCCCLASPKLEYGVHCCNSAVGKKKRGNWKKERHRRCFLRSIGIYGGSPELCTLPRTNAGGRKATYVVAAGCRALFCLTPSLPRWRWVLSSTSPPINCRRRSLFAIDCH